MSLCKPSLLALALTTAVGAPAAAQWRVDERRPAAADGIVEIENAAGQIRVIGWEREEIHVTGTLGRGAQELDFVSRARRARIDVDVRGNPNRVSSDLEIRVPAGSRLKIESYSAAIDVRDVVGPVVAESVSGAISVAGSAEVELESVSGALAVSGPAKRVRASGVNGGVTIRGVSGVVEAESVNGPLTVAGGAFQEARLETVNGPLRFDGELLRGSRLDVESVNGPIELRLPADVGAHFTLSSFGGEIDSDFEVTLGPQQRARSARERRRDRDEHEHEHEQGTELRFTTGGGGAQVSITTLNGRIALRKK